ncbi:hypothetical protein [Nocardiopsis sp. NPDC057823]|uniref:hypothetical protein n=1 Tax=Nocardiopsis sp. NPDC057823 TaxID=3346256 RepID=UPI00366FF6FA
MSKKWIIGLSILGVLVVIAGIMNATGMLDDVDPAPVEPAAEAPATPSPEEEASEIDTEAAADLAEQSALWDEWEEAAKAEAHVEAVRAVEPAFVADEDLIDRQAGRTVNTCQDIHDGLEGAELTDRVVQRMSGGTATIDAAQAEQLINAMKEHVCP